MTVQSQGNERHICEECNEEITDYDDESVCEKCGCWIHFNEKFEHETEHKLA